MFHNGEYLFVRYDVTEDCTAARVAEDNGEVWTDSCVEFFISPDNKGYYNFEVRISSSAVLTLYEPSEPVVATFFFCFFENTFTLASGVA